MLRALLFLAMILGAAAHADVLPRIIVYGNASLKPDTVIRMSGLYQQSSLSAAEVRDRLLTTNMFERVTVRRNEDVIQIYVHEKTTWFVLPYFSKDSTATYLGVAFGKSTFLGQDATVVGRYQAGTGDHEASLLVRDETLLDTPWVVGASLDYEDALHFIYTGRDVTQRTVNQFGGGSLQLGYRVTPYVSVLFNNYVEHHRYEELDGSYNAGLQWSHRLGGEWNHFYVNEGLSDGEAIKSYFEITDPLSHFQFWKGGLGGQAGVLRHGNFNWIIRGKTEYSPALPRYQLFELGGGRLRGFPVEQFRDRYYGLVQNDVLLASATIWMLKLRPLVYGDWAFIQSGGRTAVGTGFEVFVRKIAIPAIQVFVGYGFNPNGFEASAAIGPQI